MYFPSLSTCLYPIYLKLVYTTLYYLSTYRLFIPKSPNL